MNYRLWAHGGKVVAIQGDIESAHWNVNSGRIANRLRQALGQWNAPPAYPNQSQIVRSTAFFNDFMGQPLKSAANFFGGEQLSFLYDAHFAHHRSTDGE